MKIKSFLSPLIAFAVPMTLLSLAPAARADIWTELGDAGQTLPSAQFTTLATPNQPLTQIFGTLSSPGDVDIYVINLQTASTFSATTVNALTGTSGLDTQLYLFGSNGAAVYANDDDSGGLSLQSTLPAGNALSPLAAGQYYLAIATSGSEPVNNINQLLFTPDSPSFTIRGPAGNGNLSNFDTTFADPGVGAYEIDLSNAFTAIPEPGTWLAATLSLGVVFFARRRRLSRALPPASRD